MLGMDGPNLLSVVTQLRCLSPDLGSDGTGCCRLFTDVLRLCPALFEVCPYGLRAPGRAQREVGQDGGVA
jgi:hypothetical protein